MRIRVVLSAGPARHDGGERRGSPTVGQPPAASAREDRPLETLTRQGGHHGADHPSLAPAHRIDGLGVVGARQRRRVGPEPMTNGRLNAPRNIGLPRPRHPTYSRRPNLTVSFLVPNPGQRCEVVRKTPGWREAWALTRTTHRCRSVSVATMSASAFGRDVRCFAPAVCPPCRPIVEMLVGVVVLTAVRSRRGIRDRRNHGR